MLTRRRPGVYCRRTWLWLYVRALFDALIVMSPGSARSLELIENFREGVLDPQRLLDLVSRDVRILAVFDEARALVCPDEPDEGVRVRLPVRREAFEVLEHRIDPCLTEERNRVLGVLVEVGVEDALVHESRVVVEKHPPQVVQ